ncbi:MAG: DUF4340 domain-containing protein [Pseudomonadota bacterium]
MPRGAGYVILALVTVLAVVGVYREFTSRQAALAEDAGKLMFPEFRDVINNTASIAVQNAEGDFTLVRKAGTWVLKERASYPAHHARVNEMLVGLTQIKLIEKKTKKPERYAKLGLADPGSEDSDAQRYTVLDAAGKVLADLILGERKAARGEPNMNEIYVRRPGDPQTWNALAGLPNIVDTVDWLREELTRFDDLRVREVAVTHGDDPVVTVFRAAGVGQGYDLANVPEGREVDNYFIVRNVASTLVNLDLDDVRADEGSALEGAQPHTFTLRTFDGLELTMETVKVDDDRLVRLSAKAIEPVAAPAAFDESDRKEDKVVIKTADEVAAEIERLNRQWQGYLFSLADWRIAPSYKPLAELLKAPEEEGTTPSGAEAGGNISGG